MGNRFGWFLGGSLLVVLVAIIVVVAWFPSPSAPTRATTAPGVLSFHEQRMTPKDLTGREPTGSGNAGDCYYQAYTECMANWDLIDTLKNRAGGLLGPLRQTGAPVAFNDSEVKMLANIADLVGQGARRKEIRFVLEHTSSDLPVIGDLKIAEDIVNLQHPLMLYASYLAARKQYAEAERVMQDMLTMGYHFVCERALLWMTKSGLSFQRQACGVLEPLYADPFYKARAGLRAKVREYKDALRSFSAAIDSKLAVTRNLSSVENCPGDVFNIAENDADRAWRVEGILKLGQVKFTARARGDKRYVRKLIDKYLESDDPVEAAAAKAADAYTVEQYRMSGRRRQ